HIPLVEFSYNNSYHLMNVHFAYVLAPKYAHNCINCWFLVLAQVYFAGKMVQKQKEQNLGKNAQLEEIW
ncbi:hypothetical protein, partial [Escherichia coli]|uniref:hypothetical protein n=1 Tax=Escherichia coli TaxID=562 RepID=UPI003F479CB3